MAEWINSIYQSRGVSATKDDVHRAVSGQDQGLLAGSFCKIMPDLAGDPDYCLSIHADGAGTKSSVAYLMYRESRRSGMVCRSGTGRGRHEHRRSGLCRCLR